MIKAEEAVGNFYDIQEAVFNSDIKKLALLIKVFGDTAEDKAYEYIDEQLEAGRTIKDLYDEIFKGINEKGFFNQKLEADIQTLPVNVNKLTKEMYEKYMNKEIRNANKHRKN